MAEQSPPVGRLPEPDPTAAHARRLARSVDPAAVAERMRSLSASPETPRLTDIAKDLGVSAIVNDASLDRLGRTIWGADGPEIRLQDGLPSARRRFTLAHELVHVYLGHGRGTGSKGTQRHDFRYEESIADTVAGLLLVPEKDVRELRSIERLSIADVRQAAERRGVSQAVVVRRLSDQDRSHHWLLINLRRVDRGHGPWVVWSLTGRVRGLDSSVDLLESEFTKLDRLPDSDVHIQLLARVGGVVCELRGTGNRWKNLTMMLVSHIRSLEGESRWLTQRPLGQALSRGSDRRDYEQLLSPRSQWRSGSP